MNRALLRSVAVASRVVAARGIPAIKPAVSVQVRSLGLISDTLGKFATKRVDSTKEKNFETMVSSMLANPEWNLRPWKRIMEDQLGSWIMYIPGMSNSNDVKELKGLKEILDAMTDAELDKPELINGAGKERIARAANKPVDQVLTLLFLHKQSRVIAHWLKMKKDAGEALPTNDVELQNMMQNDIRVRAISAKVMNPTGAPRKSGRGRRMF